MLHHPEYAHRDKKRAQETKPKGKNLHNHPRQGSFEPRERIPGMSAEYTPERYGGVSVGEQRGSGQETSHHKYAGRRRSPWQQHIELPVKSGFEQVRKTRSDFRGFDLDWQSRSRRFMWRDGSVVGGGISLQPAVVTVHPNSGQDRNGSALAPRPTASQLTGGSVQWDWCDFCGEMGQFFVLVRAWRTPWTLQVCN
jgi:hypothetical protein